MRDWSHWLALCWRSHARVAAPAPLLSKLTQSKSPVSISAYKPSAAESRESVESCAPFDRIAAGPEYLGTLFVFNNRSDSLISDRRRKRFAFSLETQQLKSISPQGVGCLSW
jgi:hypothetical protein